MFVSYDDMFLDVDWLVEELIANFDRCADIGWFSQFRGLNVFPPKQPIKEWKDIHETDLRKLCTILAR